MEYIFDRDLLPLKDFSSWVKTKSLPFGDVGLLFSEQQDAIQDLQTQLSSVNRFCFKNLVGLFYRKNKICNLQKF